MPSSLSSPPVSISLSIRFTKEGSVFLCAGQGTAKAAAADDHSLQSSSRPTSPHLSPLSGFTFTQSCSFVPTLQGARGRGANGCGGGGSNGIRESTRRFHRLPFNIRSSLVEYLCKIKSWIVLVIPGSAVAGWAGGAGIGHQYPTSPTHSPTHHELFNMRAVRRRDHG